jgi:hypothetical protein
VSPDVAENELVAVARRPRHAVDAGHTAGAADVFHDDRLTELAAQSLGKKAGDRIGRSAGGEWYHHRDRPRRIVLRTRRCRPRGRRTAEQRDERAPSYVEHGGLLPRLAPTPDTRRAMALGGRFAAHLGYHGGDGRS